MLRGIHHVAISTPDIERLVTFYEERLGFQNVFTGEWGPGERPATDLAMRLDRTACKMVMLQGQNCFVEMFQFNSPRPSAATIGREVNDHGYTHLCLSVDDIHQTWRQLTACGVEFHCEPQDRGPYKFTYFRDPDQNIIELIEFSEDLHPFAMARLGLPQA